MKPMVPKPAATVIVARPAAEGIEVLMLTRGRAARFAPGFAVFPGGSVDPEDVALAQRLFADRRETLRACAVRELYEEAGILLTSSGPVTMLGRPTLDEIEFDPPAVSSLPEVARWIAPESLEVRFDARFYAVAAPEQLEPKTEGDEVEDARWSSPTRVLAGAERGETPLMWPTRVTLTALVACATVDDVVKLRMDQVAPGNDA